MDKYKAFYVPGAILLGALIISGSIITAGGGISLGQNIVPGPSGAPKINGDKVEFTINEDDHMRGNKDAKITMVEFSDFECPFCSRFHPTAKQAMEEYGDDIRWIYKHFPLDSIHSDARPAAEASECVWEQAGNDGFWTFADAMFENQERLGNALYEEVALQIGVDLAQFQTCVQERKYQDKVQNNLDEGVQGGVTGTPGTYVNGTPVTGAVPYEQLKAIIEAEL
ncbi:MAG: DsbA family protein [bacterium]|nr:DsbA family protein [bacterium]